MTEQEYLKFSKKFSTLDKEWTQRQQLMTEPVGWLVLIVHTPTGAFFSTYDYNSACNFLDIALSIVSGKPDLDSIKPK